EERLRFLIACFTSHQERGAVIRGLWKSLVAQADVRRDACPRALDDHIAGDVDVSLEQEIPARQLHAPAARVAKRIHHLLKGCGVVRLAVAGKTDRAG